MTHCYGGQTSEISSATFDVNHVVRYYRSRDQDVQVLRYASAFEGREG